MVLVIPNDRWLNQTLRVPFVGRVSRNGKDPVDVSEQAAKWLVANCFARLPEGAVEEKTVTPPGGTAPGENPLNPAIAGQDSTHDQNQGREGEQVTESEQSQDQSQGGEQTTETEQSTELEAWQSKSLTFLNEQDSEAIADAINGIGPSTADSLVNAKPLTWESISQILSKTQLKALKQWAES